jgi:deoxyribodipyrimidine photo-lyase
MLGCLAELQKSYQKIGSQLLILNGNPETILVKLPKTLNVEAVYCNQDVEPYAIKRRDQQVKLALEKEKITFYSFWDQLLHYPEEIVTKTNEKYKVYTPFWRNWIAKSKPFISQNIENVKGLSEEKIALAKETGVINLPSLKELSFEWENDLLLAPGETAAKQQLEYFCDSLIYEYNEQRNYPAIEGTSQLSAALKFGAIAIRTLWQASVNCYENCRSDEARNNVQTWQQELAWREFYQHCMYNFPELEQGPYRQEFKDFPWQNDEKLFQAWCDGKTGYPIVDAAMRQLNETGWMHNRCRMIVASFLTKDLIIDWKWGEKYFMQKLYDGDLSANNGGWQWSASSGMDPKPLRIFNPASQAQKFDPDGEYIKKWLPELSSLDTADLVTGKISSLERYRCNYSQPIVDHKIQQNEFKKLYKMQKIS